MFLSGELRPSSNTWVLDEVDLQPHHDPADSADKIRKHVLRQSKEKGGVPRSRRNAAGTILQVPVRGLLLSTLSEHSHLHSDVARNVPFSARLQGLASKAVSRLLELTGAVAFNGVHLRIEGDSPNQDFMQGVRPRLRRIDALSAELTWACLRVPQDDSLCCGHTWKPSKQLNSTLCSLCT